MSPTDAPSRSGVLQSVADSQKTQMSSPPLPNEMRTAGSFTSIVLDIGIAYHDGAADA